MRAPHRPDTGVLLTRGAHLLILWTLAVAQPLFDLLGRNPEFFAIRDSPGLDIVVFAVAVVVVAPLVLVAIEALGGLLDARLGVVLHLLFVGLLVATLALPLLKRTGSGSGSLLLPAALAIGGAAVLLYARWRPARTFLTVLSPAALLLVVLFLFFSPVTELVVEDEADARVGRDRAQSPVVLIVLDELPLTSLLGADGRIDARRYPNFAALARGSHWFRNTATVDAFTQVAVPAILTGRRPTGDELPNFADHPDNLFTLLAGGHRLHVRESITQLCPRELCRRTRPAFAERLRALASDLNVVALHLLLPDDLRDGLPSIDSSWQDFRGGPDLATERPAKDPGRVAESQLLSRFREEGSERRGLAEDFLGRAGVRGRDGQPPLDFLHLLLPHVPWQYLPDGSTYARADDVPGLLTDQIWAAGTGVTDTAYQRHLLQLGLLDRLLGRLLGRLRARGVYEDALIAVVADHGAAFRPGAPFRAPRPENASDLLSVPFFVKAPGQRRGRVLDTQLQTVDVLPTIADLLEVRIPWRVDGRSAFAPGAARRTVTITGAGGFPVTLPSRELRRDRGEALRRKLALFGPGGGAFDLYRVGAGRRLVGRRVASLRRTSPGPARVDVDGGGLLDAVDRASGFLPIHVTGRVRGDVRHLVLAVNGTIGAVTRPVVSGSSARFSGLVPPRLLRDGSNRLEVFALEGRPGRPVLAPLARVGGGIAGFRVAAGAIRDPEGRTFRIVPGRLRGFVDRSAASEDAIELIGWAATRRFRAVDRVVAFTRGRSRVSGATTIARPDVTKANDAPPADLGFAFALPRSVVPAGPRPVEVFALSGDVATRLAWNCVEGARQDIGC